MRGLTRRTFFALLAGVVVMPKIKAQAQDMRHWQPPIDPNIRKYPLTFEECYHIACDPIEPSPSIVVWETSRNGRLSRITSEGKIEKGEFVWTKQL